MFRSRSITAAATVLLAMSLTQCSDNPLAPEIVVAPLEVDVTAATAAAFVGETFTFATAGGVLGTQFAGQSLDVAFTSTSAATFTVGGQSFSAAVSYGSCIFDFNPALPDGTTQIVVATCDFTVNATGAATGTTGSGTSTLTLGTSTSAPVTATISVAGDGTVSVTTSTGNTVVVGTASTGSATGGT
jgi:hypothetical protein